MQARFLQTEKNRIGAIERAESALGQTIPRPSVRLFTGWKSELQLLFAAFLEDAQNVSRIAQVETRQRLDEREDAVVARVLGRDRGVIHQPKRRAVCGVSLAEAIILQIKCAVII